MTRFRSRRPVQVVGRSAGTGIRRALQAVQQSLFPDMSGGSTQIRPIAYVRTLATMNMPDVQAQDHADLLDSGLWTATNVV